MSRPEGAGDADGPRVVDGPLDPASLVRGTADAASGALVALTSGHAGAGLGPSAGRDVERGIRDVERRARARFDVRRCRLEVRPGAPDGEPTAAVVVRAPHRAAAFDAARWAMTSALDRCAAGDGDAPPGARGDGG